VNAPAGSRVVALGAWTDRDGPPKSHLLASERRAGAGALARYVAHALGMVLGPEPDSALPVVIATAEGERGEPDPFLALEESVAAMSGVGVVTLVSAGEQTVAAGLWAASRSIQTLVVWADRTPAAELAVAMRLGPSPGRELATIDWPTRVAAAQDDLPRRYASNPCAGALRLYEAVRALAPGSSRHVALDPRPAGAASVSVLVARGVLTAPHPS